MATLPESGKLNAYDSMADEMASETFIIKEGRIIRVGGGIEAMKQAVEVILSVERFYYQIYSPNFGVELKGLIRKPPEYVSSMLKRRVTEALSGDSRIISLDNFSFVTRGGAMYCAFEVKTVYGTIEGEVKA